MQCVILKLGTGSYIMHISLYHVMVTPYVALRTITHASQLNLGLAVPVHVHVHVCAKGKLVCYIEIRHWISLYHVMVIPYVALRTITHTSQLNLRLNCRTRLY